MITNEASTSTAFAEHEAGRLDRAESIYRNRLTQYPDDLPTVIGLADVLTDAGQITEAEELYRRAIALDGESPAAAGAYDGLAAIRQDLGDLEAAIPASKKAAALRGSADDSFGVGNTLEYLGRISDAIDMFVLATQQKPDFSQAHVKAAQHLLAAGRFADAIPHYESAIKAHPDVAELHCNVANAFRRIGSLNNALDSCRQAIELKPKLAEAHNIMGIIWKDRRRPADALQSFKRAVECRADFPEAINNMGGIYEQIGQLEKAGPLFARAVELQPHMLEFHENLAGSLLARGMFEQGWREYDWRRLKPQSTTNRPFPQPIWDGSPLNGRTIVLYAEQGFGDTIQFLRYATLAAQAGGRVVVECQAPLAAIARQVAGVSDVIIQGEPWPECDVQAALMSMPMILRTELHSIPAPVGYISADPEKSAAWKEKLSGVAGKKVGIAWAGSATHRNDKMRSCPINRLEVLSQIPGVSLISLQKEKPSAPKLPAPPESMKLLDLTADIADYSDTAALIENLDLVITVDTSVAHLAGAMGKPVWILLSAVNDWRWLLDREDSPWYPTARLFRQTTPGDWDNVIKRVGEALRS